VEAGLNKHSAVSTQQSAKPGEKAPLNQPEEEAAQAKAEQLVTAVLPYAEQMLQSRGEFLPYAGVLTPEGKIELVEFSAADDENLPLSAKQIHDGANEILRDGAKSGKFTTTALVANVVVQPRKDERIDAVSVTLDDADGNSLEVFFPYTISEGKVGFGTAFAQKGRHYIFGP
jgi:hypothetical protein